MTTKKTYTYSLAEVIELVQGHVIARHEIAPRASQPDFSVQKINLITVKLYHKGWLPNHTLTQNQPDIVVGEDYIRKLITQDVRDRNPKDVISVSVVFSQWTVDASFEIKDE